jgi:hypothetical protein
MHSGRPQFVRITATCRNRDTAIATTGVKASCSGSILRDFRVPYPNRTGRRPTKQAGLRGAEIPCLRIPYNAQHFLLLIHLVAEKLEDGLRQLKGVCARPELAGIAMATLSDLYASLLYGAFSEFPQTDAASMAKPEV